MIHPENLQQDVRSQHHCGGQLLTRLIQYVTQLTMQTDGISNED